MVNSVVKIHGIVVPLVILPQCICAVNNVLAAAII